MSKIQEMANRAAAIADLCQLLAAVEAKAKLTVVARMVADGLSTEFELDITQSQRRELIEPTLQRLSRQVGLSVDGFLAALGLLFDAGSEQQPETINQDIARAVDVATADTPAQPGTYGFDTSSTWYTTLHPETHPDDEFPGPARS